ncbi:DUF262 domain-containing protein [Methylosinus sp. PW1]|uniref:DUF262 domain-containing protein n=1 Tax=Methylosinus sp. PW1 TaxID=107636 RepID=UPI0009FE54E4|nr:DUF262 domain-containing protein [Methylosinus sp. PW1]
MSADKSSPHPSADDENETAPDAIDDEDTGRGDAFVKPWDPGKIRITTKHFSLRDVVDQIRDKDIDLSPDFQRDYVWKQRQRTRLIESILLGIPLPAFYFNQDNEGKYQVVDGVQRLSTISLFMQDNHTLDKADLEYLTDLHDLKFSELDSPALRRFRSTQIVVHIIEPQTPDEVKYDIFSRVNTLGSPLSAQEIRHAMSKQRSRDFLTELSEMREFDEATQWHYWRRTQNSNGRFDKVRDSGRMTNRELILRFCAFRNYSDAEYRKHSSLDAFLVAYTKRLDGCSSDQPAVSAKEMDELKVDFSRAMQNAHNILQKAAFRRFPPNQVRRGPINRAVFEAQAIALADYRLDLLLPNKQKIVDAFRSVFADPEYSRSVTVGTGDPKAVERRLCYTKDILAGAIK